MKFWKIIKDTKKGIKRTERKKKYKPNPKVLKSIK